MRYYPRIHLKGIRETMYDLSGDIRSQVEVRSKLLPNINLDPYL
jgi:hypothetical protein